jgi:D-inositol-3-phosphate glycosyltransferase
VEAAYDDSAVVTRIAVLSYHSSPLSEPGSGDAGGMTVYVRCLAEALERRGVHTDVFTRAATEQAPVVQVSPGMRVVNVDAGPRAHLDKEALARYVGDFAAGVRTFSDMEGARYDVVHSHYWQSGLAGIDVARTWGVPLVHSQHTLAQVKNSFLAPGDTPEPPSRLEGEAAIIDGADVLIASTDDEWSQLSCLYGASHDRLKTIHPGVDHRVFRPGDRARARAGLGLEEDVAVMLYVGRIQPLKGLELAVRAAEQLVPALDRELVFLVVGGASGPRGESELARINQLVDSLGLQSNVRFAGAQPHRALPNFYRAADVLVVCSHSESFGLAALEAHACGTPVVGTPVGGLSHIVRDGESGWLADNRDPALFAGRLKTLLSDVDLWEAFSEASLRSAARFSWDRSAGVFRELYNCLVREPFAHTCTC